MLKLNAYLISCCRDKQLWLALLGGCVVWLGLFFMGLSVFQRPAWPVELPLLFLTMVVVYPVLEEIVFRGLLQGWLLHWLWAGRLFLGVTVANILTSIVFVTCHLWSHAPLWALAVVVPSLLFGHFRDRDENLRIPIFLHIFYNAGWFWIFTTGLF